MLGHQLGSVRARLLAGFMAVAALASGGAAIERTADAVDAGTEHTAAVEHVWADVETLRAADGLDANHGLPQVGDPSTIEAAPRGDDLIIRFGGRVYEPIGTLRMRVTAYSPDARSCGRFADGITASGKPVSHNGGFLVAADTRLLPFGTMISVPGYFNGWPVPVLDRGGAIKGHRLDVLFPTHARARRWGVQHLDVVVWREVTEP